MVFPADTGRCGHRLIWPARALAAQGADVTVVTHEDPVELQLHADWRVYADGTRVVDDVHAPDADVVVFQRPLEAKYQQAIPALRAKGVRVVVDVDDDFAAISPKNISWRACHPRHSPERNWDHLAAACRLADLVTVTTPALARRYGGHGRAAIVPNHVPASYLEVTREPHDGVVVGWTGSIETHPDDLQVTRGGVARAVEVTGASFAVVGTGKGVQQALGLREPPVACGWVPLEDYPRAVANFDVGIVPLELTAFNEAKSALKGLEYAALGVPFVASPTGPYFQLPWGVGMTAERGRDWVRKVEALIADDQLRADRAAGGREWAATQTVEANCSMWWDAWASVVNAVCA